MSEIIIRSYSHATDYFGVKANLEAASIFDADYESESQLGNYAKEHPKNIVVASDGHEIVGSIYLQDSDIIPVLSRLAVKETYRRQGIGSHLVKAAETVAQQHGHTFLEVWVNSNKEWALSFWRAMGYRRDNPHFNMVKQLAA